MEKGAYFSPCRKYRYTLERIWNQKKDYVCFVCLNPSTADENYDDPTIRRCIRFVDSWGFGGLIMVNLFAFRATKPKDMFAAKEPIGPWNDTYIEGVSSCAAFTIMAWGNNGNYLNRDKEVEPLLSRSKHIILTKAGHPGHPLFLGKHLKPVRIVGRR